MAARGELLHYIAAAAERGQRKAAAGDLAEQRQVRDDAEALLRAAAGDPETCDHLVEDEQRLACVAEIAQRLEKAGRRRHDTHVPRDRFDDDRGEALSPALDRGRGRVDVVVRDDDRVLRRPARHARRRRDP